MTGRFAVHFRLTLEVSRVRTVTRELPSADPATETEPTRLTDATGRAGAAHRATVIVPAYNEETGLAAVLHQLREVLDDGIEILVVDDGSTDRTLAVAQGAGAVVMRHRRNRGKGAAIRSGLARARGERVVVIDADGTYPVREIPRLLDLLDRYDLAIGARQMGRANIPLLNRIGNATFSIAIRRLSGFRSADPLTGLYAAHRRHLLAMGLRSEGFAIEAEIAMKSAALGLVAADHPIPYGARVGTTKLEPLRDGAAIALTVARLALDRVVRRGRRSIEGA